MSEENLITNQEPQLPVQQPVEVSMPPVVQPEPAAEPIPTEQPQTPPLAPPEPVSAPPASQPLSQPASPTPKSFLAQALESIQLRKKAKLDKIIKFAQEKKSITNDQVQKLLRVSDATATRYLSGLVRQNKLKRLGAPQNPTYEPPGGSNGGN